jgi:hypothetical protein
MSANSPFGALSTPVVRLVTKSSAVLAFGLLIFDLLLSPAFGKRVALLIGNSEYAQAGARLENPVNDVTAVAAALKRLGFEPTVLKPNIGSAAMRDALGVFKEAAEGAEIALFYYAGHGFQSHGKNYLVPIDSTREGVNLDDVLRSLGGARNLRLIILDSCRTSLDGITLDAQGFAPPAKDEESLAGTLIVYAAAEGRPALDGPKGGHSPFTQALLSRIETPGIDVTFVFRYVRDDVMKATSREQQPHLYGSLPGDILSLKPALIPVQARYERIVGIRETAYSAAWGSAWLDLKSPTKFSKGEHLQITLRDDNAKRILVRLLQSNHAPDQPADLVGDGRIYSVPPSRIVDVVLDQDYLKTTQISVHGNPNPWDYRFGQNYLGRDNGPALLLSVDRVP